MPISFKLRRFSPLQASTYILFMPLSYLLLLPLLFVHLFNFDVNVTYDGAMWQIAVSLLDPKYIPIAEQYLPVYLLSHLLSSIVYLIWQSVDTNKRLWLNIKLCNLLISRWDRLQGGWEERGRDAEDVILIVFQQQANAPCRGIIEYGQCMILPSPSSFFPLLYLREYRQRYRRKWKLRVLLWWWGQQNSGHGKCFLF